MARVNNIAISLLLGVLSFSSCASDDELSSEAPVAIYSETVYLEFNKWIYSKMNHDYLWRNDMPDSISCNYELDPVSFYKSLLSSKDRFSYCETNDSYNPPTEKTNLGYEYQQYELENGLEFAQVLLVTSQDLKKQGLRRGDIVLPQPDKNIIIRGKIESSGIVPRDTLEAASPFGYSNTVYIDSIYSNDSTKIGYFCYLQFDDISDLTPVIKKFYDSRIDELILDLRYNPGGYVNTCKYLSNSIVNERGYNDIFQQCTYNDILTKELEKDTGNGKTFTRFSTPDNGKNVLGSPMYGLNLKRVFVLTSMHSASASEAAIISIRPFMDVIIIGERTYGKGVGSWTIRDNKYRYQLQPITMRYHNALMETTPDEGIAADFYVPDGYSTLKKELGDRLEPLLAKAFDLILGTQTTDSNETDFVRSRPARTITIKEKGTPSFFRLPTVNLIYDNHLDSQEILHNDNTHY